MDYIENNNSHRSLNQAKNRMNDRKEEIGKAWEIKAEGNPAINLIKDKCLLMGRLWKRNMWVLGL